MGLPGPPSDPQPSKLWVRPAPANASRAIEAATKTPRENRTARLRSAMGEIMADILSGRTRRKTKAADRRDGSAADYRRESATSAKLPGRRVLRPLPLLR